MYTFLSKQCKVFCSVWHWHHAQLRVRLAVTQNQTTPNMQRKICDWKRHTSAANKGKSRTREKWKKWKTTVCLSVPSWTVPNFMSLTCSRPVVLVRLCRRRGKNMQRLICWVVQLVQRWHLLFFIEKVLGNSFWLDLYWKLLNTLIKKAEMNKTDFFFSNLTRPQWWMRGSSSVHRCHNANLCYK